MRAVFKQALSLAVAIYEEYTFLWAMPPRKKTHAKSRSHAARGHRVIRSHRPCGGGTAPTPCPGFAAERRLFASFLLAGLKKQVQLQSLIEKIR